MVNITFDTTRCIQCGLCAKTCAMGHLRMTENGPAATGRGACMGCLQCAAICPQTAVLADGKSAVRPHAEDPVEERILSRRSVRKFKNEPPDRALIQWALNLSAYAPSGKNRHETRFTVVYGREKVQTLYDMAIQHCRDTGEAPELARFADKGLDLLTCGAPALIIAWSPDDCLNPCVDAAIAMEVVDRQRTWYLLGRLYPPAHRPLRRYEGLSWHPGRLLHAVLPHGRHSPGPPLPQHSSPPGNRCLLGLTKVYIILYSYKKQREDAASLCLIFTVFRPHRPRRSPAPPVSPAPDPQPGDPAPQEPRDRVPKADR